MSTAAAMPPADGTPASSSSSSSSSSSAAAATIPSPSTTASSAGGMAPPTDPTAATAPPPPPSSPPPSSAPPGSARGRPRVHGAGRKANRALRTPVTYAHKLAVIDFYDAHARDINATVREFYAHEAPAALASRKRQIYKWAKTRAAIEEMCFKQSTAGQRRRRDKGTATTLGAQGELELVRWIQSRTGAVAAEAVRARALEIAAQHGVPAGAFQATWSWQQGFFKRHQDAFQRV